MPKLLPKEQFGRILAQVREARGWSQSQFAKKLEKTPGEVNRWEHGRVRPELDTVVTLARVLCVPETIFMETSDGTAREVGLPYVLAPTPAILEILRLDASAAEKRASAADRWAAAELLAQENTRDLRQRISSDPEALHRQGEYGVGETGPDAHPSVE